jgi:serine/threonine protein kinase
LDLIKAKTWLCQLTSAVLYLHNLGFAHQKIGLESCYLKGDGDDIKLGCPDGLAEQVSYELIKAFSKYADLHRTTRKNQYSSFDVLFGDSKYDSMSADIWALGVVLYYFLTLQFPFKAWKNKKEMSTEVQCKRWSFIGMMDTNPKLDNDTIGIFF